MLSYHFTTLWCGFRLAASRLHHLLPIRVVAEPTRANCYAAIRVRLLSSSFPDTIGLSLDMLSSTFAQMQLVFLGEQAS